MDKKILESIFNIDELNNKINNYVEGKKSIIIGELSEKSVHHIIKNIISNKENQEVKIKNYYADILLDENNILEIQTGNFNKLRDKLLCYLEDYNVTIVYPITYKKEINWIDKETGVIKQVAKRTEYSKFYKGFKELYKIKGFLDNNNISVVLLLVDIDEYRYLDGYDKTLKKRATKIDKVPKKIDDILILNKKEDYNYFINNLDGDFSVKDFKKYSKTTIKDAGICVNILRYLGIIEFIRKDGREYIYQKNKGDSNEKTTNCNFR